MYENSDEIMMCYDMIYYDNQVLFLDTFNKFYDIRSFQSGSYILKEYILMLYQ